MHEAFQKRCTQNYGNLISDFNTDTNLSIEIFFSNLSNIQAYLIMRDKFEEKKISWKIIDTDKKEIFFPHDVTKLETLEIIYFALSFLYKWSIPENHPFFTLCKIFVADWDYYKSMNFEKYSKNIVSELVQLELEKISSDVVWILENIEISEDDKKEIDQLRHKESAFIDFQSMIRNFTQACLESEEINDENEDNNWELKEKYWKIWVLSFDQEDYNNAILYFMIVLDFDGDGDNLTIKEYLWISLYYTGRYQEAKELLKEVYWKDKNRIESLRYLVFMDFKAYMDKNEDTVTFDQIEAERILKNAKKVYENDNDDDIKNILRQLYMILWNYNSPKMVYLEILKDDWKNLDVIFKLIKILYHLQEFEEMLKYAFLHLSLEIQNIDLWFLLRDYYAQIWEYEISKLATIIGTLYDGRKVKNGWEYLRYLNSLDLTQDDEKVYKYFMSFITQKEALT